MTIRKLSELLNALTSTGAVDEESQVTIAVSDSVTLAESYYSVCAVTINSVGDVIINGDDN